KSLRYGRMPVTRPSAFSDMLLVVIITPLDEMEKSGYNLERIPNLRLLASSASYKTLKEVAR
ncbi:MAG: hypothetical protein RMK65_01800, partial [Anaerolineae bacterium]|nr:hypothetical protein [Anaerolineae bacterium]